MLYQHPKPKFTRVIFQLTRAIINFLCLFHFTETHKVIAVRKKRHTKSNKKEFISTC